MFANINEADAKRAQYERAIRLKPNVEGVRANSLGWVVERKGISEVLVSFRGLEDLIREVESQTTEVTAAPVVEAEVVTEAEVVAEPEVKEVKVRKSRKSTAEDTQAE